jgi:hypothetical protein
MSTMTHPITGEEMRPLQCDLCDRVRSRRALTIRTIDSKQVIACKARTACREFRTKGIGS